MMFQLFVSVFAIAAVSGASANVNCSTIYEPDVCTKSNCTYSYMANACYNNTIQHSCGEEAGHGILCSMKQKCCGGDWSEDTAKCVNPGESCCSGLRHTVVCAVGDSCCTSGNSFDGACYDSKTQICCTPPSMSAGYPWSCPIGKKCGDESCI